MSETNHNHQDPSIENPVEVPAEEQSGDGETPKIAKSVTINVYDNGMIDVSNGNDEEVDPVQLESLCRTVYEDLYRQNLTQEIFTQFKNRLG